MCKLTHSLQKLNMMEIANKWCEATFGTAYAITLGTTQNKLFSLYSLSVQQYWSVLQIEAADLNEDTFYILNQFLTWKL